MPLTHVFSEGEYFRIVSLSTNDSVHYVDRLLQFIPREKDNIVRVVFDDILT